MSLTEPMIDEEEILKIYIDQLKESIDYSKDFTNWLLVTELVPTLDRQEMLEREQGYRRHLRKELQESKQRLLDKKDYFRQLKEDYKKGLEKSG